jgi:uncharacterized OsmC-like protein
MGAPKVEKSEASGRAQQVVNGLEVEQMAGIVNTVNESPDLARFVFCATNRWINGAHNRTAIKSLYIANQEDKSRAKPFVVDADEPLALLGKDGAPNPVEYVLHALAACMTTTIVFEATAAGVEIEEIESSLEGELDLRGSLGLDDGIRNGFENIRVNFKIKADAPKEKLEELFKLAEAHSSVFDIISNPVPVSMKMEIE